jgi:ABC-type glycerol-3-phosphate transport system substrate-binding protein
MKSSFQTILITVFIIGFVIAIAIFSGLFSSSSKSASTTPSGTVQMWGIIPTEQMQPYVDSFNDQNYGYTLAYSYHSPDTFYQDIITALANGTPPDLVFISSEQFSQLGNKLYTIPYTTYPERQYRDDNIDGAQIFLGSAGVAALPLLVDPMVVYYNKDILASKNFVTVPSTWDDLVAAVPSLTKVNSSNQIIQSAIALGDADNIEHYRDILSTLFLQTGNSIMAYDPNSGTNQVTLSKDSGVAGSALPAAQALDFYTSFANTDSANYTWNSALPDSLQDFLAGNLAFYLGRASELFTIQAENPNLNFDVTPMFQSTSATRPITFGSFLAVGIMAKSTNPAAANAAALEMSNATNMDTLSKTLSLPPVNRSLLQVSQPNPYISVFFQAALSSFAWPDPNPTSTDQIFHDMINNVNSNTTDSETAIYDATSELQTNAQ